MTAKGIALDLFLPLLLVSCTGDRTPPRSAFVLQGYAEGRLLYLAPRTVGPVTALSVDEGDRVEAAKMLFSLDDGTAQARLEQARANLNAARSRAADLRAGGRKQDIAAAREAVAQAAAAVKLAVETQARTAILRARGQAPQSRLDRDNATLAQARAVLKSQKARLALVRAPARKDAIAAAAAQVKAQQALLAQAKKALDDLVVRAPQAGTVQTLLRRVGEIAGPTQPVLALLPPGLVRVRFFVPEPKLGAVHVGDKVTLSCDACATGEAGHIIYIADSAEFTPPEIFTKKERAKLVYMSEALPDHPEHFHSGQPVTVTLP